MTFRKVLGGLQVSISSLDNGVGVQVLRDMMNGLKDNGEFYHGRKMEGSGLQK